MKKRPATHHELLTAGLDVNGLEPLDPGGLLAQPAYEMLDSISEEQRHGSLCYT